MPILDDDQRHKESQQGNRKYISMAEDGVDYIEIRRQAEKDGLEGRELSILMDSVDRILLKNAAGASSTKSDHIAQIILGGIILSGGIGLFIFFYNKGYIHFAPIIVMFFGFIMTVGGIKLYMKKK